MQLFTRIVLGAGLLIAAACAASNTNPTPSNWLTGSQNYQDYTSINMMTTTATPVPKHVQTVTYLWSSTEQATNKSAYTPYLTWAYPMYSQFAAVHNAGIKTIDYTTPTMPQKTSGYSWNLVQSMPSVIAKTCTGQQITAYNGNGVLTDPRITQTATYYDKVIAQAVASANYSPDIVFIDNAGPLYGTSGTPCNYTASSWGTALDNALAGVGHQLYLNSLSVSLSQVSTYVGYLKGPNIEGGMLEECFSSSAVQWYEVEEAQIQTIAALKAEGKPSGLGFECYLDNTNASASTSIQKRLFAYASFLLTYDPNYSALGESFTTSPSTFQVFPETGLVALNPAVGIQHYTDLQQPSGVYAQTFWNCAYRGTLLGQCEAVVNPTSSALSFPNSYRHSMVLSGGGVLDGGTAAFTGGPVTSLAAYSGAILIDPASPAPTAAPKPTPTPTATPSGSSITGVVDYCTYYSTSGEFQIKTATGSLVWVATAKPWDLSIAVGKKVTVYGSYSSSLFDATTVVLK